MQIIKNISKFYYLRVGVKLLISYDLTKFEEDLVVFDLSFRLVIRVLEQFFELLRN